MKTEKKALLVGAIFASATLLTFVAIAALDNEVNACVNNKTGSVRILNFLGGQCTKGETSLVWNKQGVQGIQGPQGERGPAGEPSWDEQRVIGLEERILNLEKKCVQQLTDNGDGTVYDNCTKLTWLKNPASGIGTTHIGWSEANVVCNTLVFAGRDDWRLPIVNELMTIVDYSTSVPTSNPIFVFDTDFFPVHTSTKELDHFLTLVVDFRYGMIGPNGGGALARCVRG